MLIISHFCFDALLLAIIKKMFLLCRECFSSNQSGLGSPFLHFTHASTKRRRRRLFHTLFCDQRDHAELLLISRPIATTARKRMLPASVRSFSGRLLLPCESFPNELLSERNLQNTHELRNSDEITSHFAEPNK